MHSQRVGEKKHFSELHADSLLMLLQLIPDGYNKDISTIVRGKTRGTHGSPQQIICLHLTISQHSPLSHHVLFHSLHPWIFYVLFNFSSCLAAPYSGSFVQCIHYPSLAHVQTCKTSHLGLLTLVSKPLNLSWLPNVFISIRVHPGHSHWKSVSKPYILSSLTTNF